MLLECGKTVPRGEVLDEEVVEAMLAGETLGRGCPKALYYEDVLLMVVRHLVTVMMCLRWQ